MFFIGNGLLLLPLIDGEAVHLFAFGIDGHNLHAVSVGRYLEHGLIGVDDDGEGRIGRGLVVNVLVQVAAEHQVGSRLT